ncbi:rhodanese-like domain-containing protein [Alkalinema sp. FACHB-956]|uniref:rhodanese-like domain-containing protein n=1 Tax=Alkalinema sp. FACHB-956 TaxID=2692768 RepID=UPI001686546A|nr:rhodanese-like domain-containing protein [Alkalinema sp. FACHB-956]MBD2328941.1 rhodanese-related sulfurtransferase [Alkalinema sp. FACHB-956]
MFQPTLPSISVEELAQQLANMPDSLQLVDVREPEELAIAQLPNSISLPLSQYEVWSRDIHSRLDADQAIVVLCHHGMRSAQMCQWLMGQGFTQVKNITGGIDAYSVLIDPSIPRY